MNSDIFDALSMVCKNVKKDEPMKNHTTFKIGGCADYYVIPESENELLGTLKICKEKNIPYMITGNGSNLLVSDNGIEGVVINISSDDFSKVEINGEKVYAGAGILMSRFAKILANNDLSGFECASGIPGTLGGAVYMNAGAYGFEMKDAVREVIYINEEGELKKALADELSFGYRKSMFSGRNCVILYITMEFKNGRKDEILSLMAEYTKKRNDKQPVTMPSAGSVFKRPEGYFAGALIEEAGLKGYSIGGAQVSEKHAGFIVNSGGATATDVVFLVEYIKNKVFEKSGVVLEPEIKMIGRK